MFNKAKYYLLTLLILASIENPGLTQSTPNNIISAPPEKFISDKDLAAQNEKERHLKSPDLSFPHHSKISLPDTKIEEKNLLKKQNSTGKVRIGFPRKIPEAYTKNINKDLIHWQITPNNETIGLFSITSPEAAALRVELLFQSIPKGMEVRFFSPSNQDNSVGPFTRKQLTTDRSIINNVATSSFWSPTIDGDTIGVEIYLPAGVDTDQLIFSLPRLSHLVLSLMDQDADNSLKNLAQAGASGSCNIDAQCISGYGSSFNDLNDDTISSVAKYLFTTNGFTSLCTGTLLNDLDTNTTIPHFLTARHCISSQAEASSAEFYWFFQKTSCGGVIPSSIQKTVGGASLLATVANTDTSLLKLNQSPPSNVTLSGWTNAPVSANTPILGIHHPAGDLKKASIGNFLDFSSYLEAATGSGNYLNINWSHGTTEGGSSGSGVWKKQDGMYYLVGTLHGGFASCSSDTSDYYGRFDIAFPSLRDYLASEASHDGQFLNISTNAIADTRGIGMGFIIRGGTKKVLVMARSASSGLSDPVLTLKKASGEVLWENDDWTTDPSANEVSSLLSSPAGDLDSGFVITLQPGAYVARMTGYRGQTGRGLCSVTEVQ